MALALFESFYTFGCVIATLGFRAVITFGKNNFVLTASDAKVFSGWSQRVKLGEIGCEACWFHRT